MRAPSIVVVAGPAILLSADIAVADPGPTIVPTATTRSAYSSSFVYDETLGQETFESDWQYDTTTFGWWEATAETYAYGSDHDAEGTAFHYSGVNAPGTWWGDGVYAEIWTYAYALDHAAGEATAEDTGALHVEFVVPERTRVNFYWELGAWGAAASYSVSGLISLSEAYGDDVFSYAFDTFTGDNAPFYTYLQPGAYTIDGAAASAVTASHHSDPHASFENVNAYILLWLRTYCVADFDTDTDVDAADYDAFEAAFVLDAAEADVDGSGHVDAADYDAFALAHDGGC